MHRGNKRTANTDDPKGTQGRGRMTHIDNSHLNVMTESLNDNPHPLAHHNESSELAPRTVLFDDRMYRLKQIIGDPKASPPIEPIIPVSANTWWKGIRELRFPKGIKISPRVTVWRGSDLRKVVNGETAL